MVRGSIEYLVKLVLLYGSHQLHAELPRYVFRVDSCPYPSDSSQWQDASNRLNCLHNLNSTDTGNVYHCLPSSFLNETVEFCGKVISVLPGHCPIYNYTDKADDVPGLYNCRAFIFGCPTESFSSKDVRKYPVCLEINETNRLYNAELKTTMNETRYEQSTENNEKTSITPSAEINIFPLVAVPLLLVIIFVSLVLVCYIFRKKNRKKESVDIADGEEYKLLPKKKTTAESTECRLGHKDKCDAKNSERKNSIKNTGCSKEKREDFIVCRLCENQVSFFCTTCKDNLCDKCVVLHLVRSKFKGGHMFVEFEMKDIVGFCDDHPQEEFVAFCKCCNVSICLICACVKHKTHTTLELSEKIEELLRLINQGNGRLQKCKNNTHQVIDNMTKQAAANLLSYKEEKNEEVTALGAKFNDQIVKEPSEEEENMNNEFEVEVKKFEERIRKLNEIDMKSAKLQKSKNVKELQSLLSVIEESLKEFT